MRIGVLASHEGTTLQSLIDACAAEMIDADIAVVVSNNSGSGALRRARLANIEAVHLSSATHSDPNELDAAITEALQTRGVGLVVLAGYMKKLGPRMLSAFPSGVLNTHPGPLPKFGGKGMYGMNVHRAVLDAGEAVSAATVFFVEDEYDTGPVVATRPVPVRKGDTPESLAERVQHAERELLVEVVRDMARSR